MVSVRKARKSDVAKLATLIKDVIENCHYYSVEARRDEIKRFNATTLLQTFSSSDSLIYVAEVKKELVGFRIGTIYAGVFWSEWGGTKKDYRRKGISKTIFSTIEKELKKLRVHKMWCDSRTSNSESNKSLIDAGFKKVSILKKHWWKQDFYIWEKTL